MNTRKRPPKDRKTFRLGAAAPYLARLARAVEDFGSEELLDDWMVGCPTGESVPPN